MLASVLAESVGTEEGLFFQQDNVRIYHRDAASLLGTLRVGSVSMVLTDPPYNVGIPYPGYSDQKEWPEYWAMARIVTESVKRVLRPGGVFACLLPFSASQTVDDPRANNPRHRLRRGPTIPMLAHWTRLALDAGLIYEDTISVVNAFSGEGEGYAVGTAIGNSIRPRMRVVARALLVCFNEQSAVPGRKGRYSCGKLEDHKNHWYCRPMWGKGMGHPTPMPTLAVVRAIRMWTNPGDLVVDPFCGSGIVLAEARREGRLAIGGDISEESCRISAKRLSQGVLEL